MSLCISTARRLASLPVNQRLCVFRRSLYVRQQPPPATAQLPQVEPVTVDWSDVERLLPRRTVPVPADKAAFPSGWLPQRGNASLPYTLRRSVNHMLPVYLRIQEDGTKRRTVIRGVRGDIWKLHNDLKKHLEQLNGCYVASQVNEVTQYVQFKGEFVQQAKQWLKERGL